MAYSLCYIKACGGTAAGSENECAGSQGNSESGRDQPVSGRIHRSPES